MQTTTSFSIQNPVGAQMADGGIAWRGDIFATGHKVGVVSNAGNGGCCDWCWHSLAAERAFEALAKARYPHDREAADTLAGDLWDAAIRAGVSQ